MIEPLSLAAENVLLILQYLLVRRVCYGPKSKDISACYVTDLT